MPPEAGVFAGAFASTCELTLSRFDLRTFSSGIGSRLPVGLPPNRMEARRLRETFHNARSAKLCAIRVPDLELAPCPAVDRRGSAPPSKPVDAPPGVPSHGRFSTSYARRQRRAEQLAVVALIPGIAVPE
jgi:hypothetical protein